MSKPWDRIADAYVLENYQTRSAEELGLILDRSPLAVRRRFYHISKELPTPSVLELELQWVLARSTRTTPKQLRKSPGTIEVNAAMPVRRGGSGNAYKNTRTGYRPDIGIIARSGWEANFARVLKSYDIAFQFEPTVFTFPVKRGTKGYTPDFYLSAWGEWVEIKGYLDDKSKIKMRRFKRYYPQDFANLTMVISRSSKVAREFCAEIEVPMVLFYEEFSKLFKPRIKQWEGR